MQAKQKIRENTAEIQLVFNNHIRKLFNTDFLVFIGSIFLFHITKISDNMRAEILRVIPPRMTSAIRSKVSALPSADFQNFPESILVERIVADLQGDIINVLRADAKYR